MRTIIAAAVLAVTLAGPAAGQGRETWTVPGSSFVCAENFVRLTYWHELLPKAIRALEQLAKKEGIDFVNANTSIFAKREITSASRSHVYVTNRVNTSRWDTRDMKSLSLKPISQGALLADCLLNLRPRNAVTLR